MSNTKITVATNDVKTISTDGTLEAMYVAYFTVMKPVVDIPDTCIDFLSKLLAIRQSYIDKGDSVELADLKTLSLEERKRLRDTLEISVTRMLYLFSRLRSCHVLIGNSFNTKLLPVIDKNTIKSNKGHYMMCFAIPVKDI